VKLRYVDDWYARRREHAATYARLLADSRLVLPCVAPDRSHIWYVYVIRAAERESVRQQLSNRDIGTGIHFPIPIHLQPACRNLGYVEGDLPHTESVAGEILSIPMYPELSEAQMEYVAAALKNA
jgi:dTDP-4-amino-4,6-dideoxygalactose transaminase